MESLKGGVGRAGVKVKDILRIDIPIETLLSASRIERKTFFRQLVVRLKQYLGDVETQRRGDV